MLLIHPDQSERARVMMDRYVGIIEGGEGQVHRNEDLGRRMLAYPIAKVQKAHYMLLNVECGQDTLNELVGALHFSDAVLRHLVVRREEAVTDKSVLARAAEKEAARESREFPYDKELAHGRRAKREEAGETDDKAKAAAEDAPASDDDAPVSEDAPEADTAPEAEAADADDGESEADPAPESSDEPAESPDEPAESPDEPAEAADAPAEAADEPAEAAEDYQAAEDDQAADEAEAAEEEAADASADEPAVEADSQTDDETVEGDAPADDAAAGGDEAPKEEKE